MDRIAVLSLGRPGVAACFMRNVARFVPRGGDPCKEPRKCGFSALEFDGFAVQMGDRWGLRGRYLTTCTELAL